MKNKRVIILIVVLAFLAAALVFREILFQPGEKLTLVATEPAIYQTDVDPNLKTITFRFNQPLEKFSFSLTTFPDFPYQTKVENDQLIVSPKEPLTGGEKYLIELKEKSSSFYFPLEFTTSYSQDKEDSYTPEEKGLGDPKAEEEIAKAIFEDYPLFYQTPKKTALWQADYSKEKELTVFYLSSVDRTRVEEEVFAWMESEEVNPQSHNFKWQPVDNLPN